MFFDNLLGVVFKGPNPGRSCENPKCPRDDYTGLKMKMCARCRNVRYCSPKCQKINWPEHKTVCRNPMDDAGRWIKEHAWLFQWAASQAFHPSDTSVSLATHFMRVEVFHTDRLNHKQFSSPLTVHPRSPELIDRSDKQRNWGNIAWTFIDERFSETVVKTGGIGMVQVQFVFMEVVGEPTLNILERYQLKDPSSGPQVSYWAALARGIANKEISVADMSRMIGAGDEEDNGRPLTDEYLLESGMDDMKVEDASSERVDDL